MKAFFHRYNIWIRLCVSVLLMLLLILLPFVIAVNTRSNGLGAGIYAMSVFLFVPAVSLTVGLLSSAKIRRMWFLPAVPAVLSLALWGYPTGASLSFLLTPVLALAVGYAAMLLCALFLKRKNK